MIQRQQTLWLLLAAVASFLTFRFPFYTGNKVEVNNMFVLTELDAGSTFYLLGTTAISIVFAIVAIFMYKTRKSQFWMAIGGVALSVLLLILYFSELGKYSNGNFALSAVFVLAILIGYIMAARGIWKDEKLVKSLDKLR